MAERCCCARRMQDRFAAAAWQACFTDRRSPLLVTHKLGEMLSQRIYGLALGYEDLNDHEQLRRDPLMALLAASANSKSRWPAKAR